MFNRSSSLLLLLCVALLAGADRFGAQARIQYSEGGSFAQQAPQSHSSLPNEYDLVEAYSPQRSQSTADEEERLASIVEELGALPRSDEPLELIAVPGSANGEEELRRFGAELAELSDNDAGEYGPETAMEPEEEEKQVKSPTKPMVKQSEAQPEFEEPEPEAEEQKPLVAQKKGQSEFVEFVEPAHVKLASKKLKHREVLEKRVADVRLGRLQRDEERGVQLLYSSGNILFIAFVTMCCVLSVVGVVGGAYYYKHVRSINEDPFDDFTRYSPAGPGRDKLKKGTNFTAERGDDALAYKAQLHHYQQTKQKIIGADGLNGRTAGGMEDDASDRSDDDEADLEHNFSVYECPGLAPTGDIEVTNPNFVDSAASSPTRE